MRLHDASKIAERKMSNLNIINQYLKSFYSGDFKTAETFVDKEFDFKGPFIQVTGRDNYFSAASRLVPIVRGHVMLRQWEDGFDVSSLYEVAIQTPLSSGTILMSEWNAVVNGRLTSGRLVFDTAEFRKLVPMPQA